MKKVGIIMGLLMSVTLSLCLSLTGILSSGKFTVQGFIISFLVSFVISFLISVIVPMHKINASLGRSMRAEHGSLKLRLAESLVSNLIYTPFMTVVMVTLAWFSIKRQGGEQPPYIPMLLTSLLICFAVGYIIIFIVTPIFMKIAMRSVKGSAHMGNVNK